MNTTMYEIAHAVRPVLGILHYRGAFEGLIDWQGCEKFAFYASIAGF
jgi:hypothetical protein